MKAWVGILELEAGREIPRGLKSKWHTLVIIALKRDLHGAIFTMGLQGLVLFDLVVD